MPDRKLRVEHGIGLLRETLLCRSCGSTTRQRTLAYTLQEVLRERFGGSGTTLGDLLHELSAIQLWDTDAYSAMSRVFRSCRTCIMSKYLPGEPFGTQLEPQVFNIDLQQIGFESDRFDIILSSDIMEHVRHDARAHAEIFRCLKPGGAYIFTVPFNEDQTRTTQLVETSTDQDLFLRPPHYHGDPITGGILAFRIYGRDIFEQLGRIGFDIEFKWINAAAEGIFDGDCFIARKPAKYSRGNA
jgi:SAM-dependent methyltransferase